MNSTSRNGPQYPARQSDRTTTAERNPSDERLLRITGTKMPSRKTVNLAVCTYNCRSLAKDNVLNHLMEERKKIKCDVLGLCEVRRKKALNTTWKDGCTMRLGRTNNARAVGGIGFIVSKEWASKIVHYKIISHRVGVLTIQLSKKTAIKFIQTYAPTSTADDDEVEDF